MNQTERLEEKAEVDCVLESGILGQSTNLVRMFRIICDRFFEDPESPVKEYTIAVEGLGRPLDFDPHLDPIVRVTAHQLRKRLKDYYAGEGQHHTLQIALPRGRYSPQFIRQSTLEATLAELPIREIPHVATEQETALIVEAAHPEPIMASPRRRVRPAWIAAAVFCALAVAVGVTLHFSKGRAGADTTVLRQAVPASLPKGQVFRMLVGDNRDPFKDEAGNNWTADRFCEGGNTFRLAPQKIIGTVTPEIFLAGRHGKFHCSFPAPAGLYEAHLYFAETADVEDATQHSVLSFNRNPVKSVDVIDFAPGRNVATEKLIPGLEPGRDGRISLEFIDGSSLLNAIELVPVENRRLQPIRISIGDKDYLDDSGALWISDRFFTGGRRSYSGYGENGASGIQYRSARVGHFTYSIPVVSGATYTVRLHFVESWFGSQEDGKATGRRIFDVACNGKTLLKDFDVFAESGRTPIIKTFHHIEPNGLGKIDLEFLPVEDYAIVNGIEIIEE